MACCGFFVINNLGQYLGVPLLHGRVSRSIYFGILEKVKNSLSGWAASSLSMVGRTMLVNSALSSIPLYTM